jgi:hypothetical protein
MACGQALVALGEHEIASTWCGTIVGRDQEIQQEFKK